MSKIIYSSENGFLKTNDGNQNRLALQKMLDIGGDIYIDEPGIYDVLGTVFISDNTTLKFCAGSYIRRINDENGNDSLIYNKGAKTKEYNYNIVIDGMNLICNDVNITKSSITGMYAQIGFFYTKHTVIQNFKCYDLGPRGFCIQICTFEDSRIENVHIEGMKDAVHYGPGNRFILRNGVFRTYDDPVALNANDYAIANPEMGWIENGLIEYCFDLNQDETTGFFCRLLAGSWLDWKEGMIIRNSDTVVSNNRMYRAKMPPDGKEYISKTKPTFEQGEEVLDGILWVMTQDRNVTYNCGCRNIHFRDIYLKKNRPCAFAFHFDNDVHSHSYYPYSDAPVQMNITFENIYMLANVPYLIRSTTPVDNIRIINSDILNTSIRMAHRGVEGINYPKTTITIQGCKIDGTCKVSGVEGRKIVLNKSGNIENQDSIIELDGDIDLI